MKSTLAVDRRSGPLPRPSLSLPRRQTVLTAQEFPDSSRDSLSPYQETDPTTSLWILGTDRSNSVSVMGMLIEGLYSLRNRHCPHLSLTHTGWHLKMPYFELKLTEICIQEFKEVWEMGIRRNVDFKLFTDFSELMHYAIPSDMVLSSIDPQLPPSHSENEQVAPTVIDFALALSPKPSSVPQQYAVTEKVIEKVGLPLQTATMDEVDAVSSPHSPNHFLPPPPFLLPLYIEEWRRGIH